MSITTTHEPSAQTQALSSPEKWVDLYGNYLYRYALTRLRDDEAAQDAVQETFLAALKAQQSFSGRSSEKTWLVGILKHKIIDTFRKHSREVSESETVLPFERENVFRGESDDWAGHWKNEYKPADWGDTPLAATERKDFQRVFQSCFQKLPERTALAFAMKEIDDVEAGEICTALEITEANLWVMLHRARMHLRRCLELRWFAVEQR
jgi:RNA polymerase sigma-70 factor (ECF subfamily)